MSTHTSPVVGTVVGVLADRLRRDISLGILSPGDRLNIEAIKREHKVSHPSVREALALLAGEGYVVSEDQKGFRVLASSTEELVDMVRVRAELECTALAWSIARADRDWRANIVAAHFALSEVEADMRDDIVSFALEWDEKNRAFHLALGANCGSPRLLSLIAGQYDLSRRYRLMAYAQDRNSGDQTDWLQISSDEHGALKDAALAGDLDTAQTLLRSHITKSAESLSADVIPLRAES